MTIGIDISVEVKVRGLYRLQVHREGELRHDTGWFENLITDQGVDWIGGNNPKDNTSYGGNYLNTHCSVGTGNATPAYTDTQLSAFLAMYPSSVGSNVEGFSTSSYVAGPPVYWSGIWNYTFAVGAVVGNIAEVGVGCTASTDTQPQLFSRALIVDGTGTPTTISLTASDALTVTYELRYYIDTTDNTYSMTISGTTYTGTYRRMDITTVPSFYFPVFGSYNGAPTGDVQSQAYNGFVLGPVTGTPSYTYTDGNNNFSYSNTAYSSGSYVCQFSTFMPLSRANWASGINGFSTTCNHGSYQFSISPAIPKTSSYTLQLNWSVSWSRY